MEGDDKSNVVLGCICGKGKGKGKGSKVSKRGGKKKCHCGPGLIRDERKLEDFERATENH